MSFHNKNVILQQKIVVSRKRVYVPDSTMLQEEIITRHYDSELARHSEYTKTHELITRNYW